ncbi:SIMPL domain-containing protein [Sphingomonas sp.]|uniref:SIMPL domain-containing protein n=1 Tax=Sphingomonas sp. TaxID=28214 RepID=UPI0035C7EE66
MRYAWMLAAAVPAAPALAEVPILPDATVLDVSAVGRITQAPDIATVRAGVVAQAPTAAAAMAEAAERMARVTAALRSAGVAERDIRTSTVSLSPRYRYAENQPPVVTGYQASNGVTVRFREIGRTGRVLDALVSAGANQIDGPQLSIDRADAALDAARTDAVQRARARADLYAKAAGLSVARIVSIGEAGENDGATPHPPIAYMARAKADSPPTELSPGETEVTATITVRFLLR